MNPCGLCSSQGHAPYRLYQQSMQLPAMNITDPPILTALLHVSPQVSGRARASAKCWDTRTDAGAPRPPDPTPAWPARPKCPPSPGRRRFPGTRGGKTTIRLSCLKPAGCKVCTKKFSTRSSTISSLVPRHRPGYRKRMRSPSQNTQTLKESSKNKTKQKSLDKGLLS